MWICNHGYRRIFSSPRSGDYFGMLAYVEMNAAHEDALQEIRHMIRDSKKVATVPWIRTALPALDGSGI